MTIFCEYSGLKIKIILFNMKRKLVTLTLHGFLVGLAFNESSSRHPQSSDMQPDQPQSSDIYFGLMVQKLRLAF